MESELERLGDLTRGWEAAIPLRLTGSKGSRFVAVATLIGVGGGAYVDIRLDSIKQEGKGGREKRGRAENGEEHRTSTRRGKKTGTLNCTRERTEGVSHACRICYHSRNKIFVD